MEKNAGESGARYRASVDSEWVYTVIRIASSDREFVSGVNGFREGAGTMSAKGGGDRDRRSVVGVS